MIDFNKSAFTINIKPPKPDLLFETWTKQFGDVEADTRQPLVLSFGNNKEITCNSVWATHSVLISNPYISMIKGGHFGREHTNIDIQYDMTFNLFYGIFETVFQFEDNTMIDEHFAYDLASKIKRFGKCVENLGLFLNTGYM